MSDSGDVIQLDDLALLMWSHLKQHLEEEPAVPSEDDDRYQHEEKAALHYEWARAHQAIRLMMGIRLIALAEAQL